MTLRRAVLAGALLAVAAGARAQAAAVADRKALTLDGARAVVAAALTEARRLGAGGAVAVVDDGGHLVSLDRLDGTFPAASTVSIEKAHTAATFRRPTKDLEDAVKSGRVALVSVDVMTPLQGGVPLVIDGLVVGAVGVSGAASAQADEEIARHAAASLK